MYAIVSTDLNVYGVMESLLCNDGMGYGWGVIHRLY